MKRIEAIVRRHKLPEVKLALTAVSHRGLTACDTTEHDPRNATALLYRSSSCISDMAPRVSISVLVEDADASAAVDAILRAARTGHDGDGTIVVVPVEEVVHISGAAAVA
jgi:nitrogen regulatory protein P-II 1